MKIADGIYMLEVLANALGNPSTIHPTLIWDEDSATLVDTGFPGQLSQIHEVIEKEGVPFNKLDKIILTHQDIDHVGNISGIQNELPGRVKILCHKEEKPYIDGEKQPVKLAQLESNLENLPENMKMVFEKLKAGFQSSRADIDMTLTDGEELPYCGGIIVVHTPGHTPGHICLYLKQSKLLIAGDMLNIKEGMLSQNQSSINFDMELYAKSMKKLMDYDIEAVICYHGGLYKEDVNKRIAELAGA